MFNFFGLFGSASQVTPAEALTALADAATVPVSAPDSASPVETRNSKYKYGYRPDLPDHRDHRVPPRSTLGSPPPKTDLRPGMPPVYDQLKLGSCTAQAVAAALEYDEKKQALPAYAPSRLFIYYNERALDRTVTTDSGSSLRDGIKTVAKKGYCSEADWPYDIAKFAQLPPKECYTIALEHRAVAYKRVRQSLTDLQQVLADGFPIVFGISVYESFEDPEVLKTGVIPMPKKTEQLLGGHAIVLCGYDTEAGTFLFRNSWGAEAFGEGGYGTLPFDYVVNPDLAQDFWVVTRVSVGDITA
jgi:C1A family cysteine protease